jgi:hypothetical protein
VVYKPDSSTASYIDFVATLDEDGFFTGLTHSSESSLETVGVEQATRNAENRNAKENDRGIMKSNIEKGIDVGYNKAYL